VDSHDHVKRLRHAYQQWNDTRGGSVETWLELFADDVVMRPVSSNTGEHEFAKNLQGKADAGRYLAGLMTLWEMIHFTPEQFIADGERVVVVSRVAFKSRATGKVAETSKADIFQFREGKVVEVMEFFDTAAALAASRPD
jgi:uncharacterized protein